MHCTKGLSFKPSVCIQASPDLTLTACVLNEFNCLIGLTGSKQDRDHVLAWFTSELCLLAGLFI